MMKSASVSCIRTRLGERLVPAPSAVQKLGDYVSSHGVYDTVNELQASASLLRTEGRNTPKTDKFIPTRKIADPFRASQTFKRIPREVPNYMNEDPSSLPVPFNDVLPGEKKAGTYKPIWSSPEDWDEKMKMVEEYHSILKNNDLKNPTERQIEQQKLIALSREYRDVLQQLGTRGKSVKILYGRHAQGLTGVDSPLMEGTTLYGNERENVMADLRKTNGRRMGKRTNGSASAAVLSTFTANDLEFSADHADSVRVPGYIPRVMHDPKWTAKRVDPNYSQRYINTYPRLFISRPVGSRPPKQYARSDTREASIITGHYCRGRVPPEAGDLLRGSEEGPRVITARGSWSGLQTDTEAVGRLREMTHGRRVDKKRRADSPGVYMTGGPNGSVVWDLKRPLPWETVVSPQEVMRTVEATALRRSATGMPVAAKSGFAGRKRPEPGPDAEYF